MLRRIREEIDARRAAGEKLPAPPKTAIAGPEYFGFNQPEVKIDARPDEHRELKLAEGDLLPSSMITVTLS